MQRESPRFSRWAGPNHNMIGGRIDIWCDLNNFLRCFNPRELRNQAWDLIRGANKAPLKKTQAYKHSEAHHD